MRMSVSVAIDQLEQHWVGDIESSYKGVESYEYTCIKATHFQLIQLLHPYIVFQALIGVI